ncbi:MAG: ABC transporter ATP-binding protein [Acetivibrionales bacterium]|jgi:ABC-2 type transport system ATP-binding protein
MNVIEIRNLTKYYGKSRGIIDVSFDVEEGEIFGFIGPNGAGKSTTIRLLLALIFPTSGNASIFGKDCIRHAPEIAKDIGYMPSEISYYDNMKVWDLLKYSASFYSKDCTKRIRELAEIMDLDLNRKIADLSLGNRKKVGIVQGLLHEPRLIILDEPTSGLDPLMQKKFFDLIREENRKGATVLFSSHILGEVQKLCHRVAIIKEGRIVKVEKVSALTEDTCKKFRIELRTPVDSSFFDMKGASDIRLEGNTASFMYKGSMNSVIRKIAEADLENIWIEEPTLEEVFMHYYEKEEGG